MISAIILAAGQSKRMGQPKLLMPWGKTCVIGQVLRTLREAGVDDIHLVTGGLQSELKEALKEYEVDFLYNKDFADGEMLRSVKAGLQGLGGETDATLIVLGDQPQIESRIVRLIVDEYNAKHSWIIVPSYNMHRGHPWLVDKSYWRDILDLNPPLTLQKFLTIHDDAIDYVVVDTASVIQDLDTQIDYNLYKP